MREPNDEKNDRRMQVGSLFSGYGGLNRTVGEAFDARTIWFSGFNEPIARTLAHHCPDAPTFATSPRST